MKGAAAALVLLAACARTPAPTGIVIEVDTDLAIPASVDGIRVQVRNEEGASLYEREVDLRQDGPASQLPGRMALQPENPDQPAPVTISATALRAGAEVLRQEARLSFRPGAVVLLRMPLLAGCACQRCEPGEICGEGVRCEAVARDVNALPLYAPRAASEARPQPTSCPVAPEGLPDASPPDATAPSTDGSAPAAPDAGPPAPPDAGPDVRRPADAGADAGSGKDAADAAPPKDTAPPPDLGTTPLPTGVACTSGAQCGSRACVDGVCCASACGSRCMACAKALTGQPDGQCAPVRAGTDPRSDCAADAPTTCRYDGTCDGAGACRLQVAGTLCGSPTCAAGAYTPPSRCTGAGVCNPEPARQCLLFACTLDRGCLTRCQTHADCAADAYCAAGDCAAQKGNGQSCAESRECASGSCKNDHCTGG